jgi:hypothetical protein
LYPFQFEIKDLDTKLDAGAILNNCIAVFLEPLLKLWNERSLEVTASGVLAKTCGILYVKPDLSLVAD